MTVREAQRGFTLIELLIVVAIIGIIAAIAIPGLLRARASANESGTIGDIRTVISAEANYHSASGGFYGTPVCLVAPTGAGCLPSYPTNAPTFVDSQIAALAPKSGYSRSMDDTAAVPGGLTCFHYSAVPINPGQTGVRGFGGDCSGQICTTPAGTAVPPGGAGQMLSGCNALQ